MGDRITSIEFRNFKAFQSFDISISRLNLLVGPNNSGKSTIVSAIRALEVAMRRANSRKPDFLVPDGSGSVGYYLQEENMPMSVENVHTDYSDEDSSVNFRLSNGNSLRIVFESEGGISLLATIKDRSRIRTPSMFRQAFPIIVRSVPVLGPLEHNEPLVEKDTVTREQSTHRASRHFRNYWHYFPEEFDAFAEMIHSTWPEMEIDRPDKPNYSSKTVSMFCRENRITRELYWAGFGFQVWCQLLTHISRSRNASILVVDEPEIYLHPDVQRQLVDILKASGPDIVVATHSSEIIAQAEPVDIHLIDKTKRRSRRLTDVTEVQIALELIGSIQNITLTNLAMTRRVVFVEDESDFLIIRRFAKILGFTDLAAAVGITPVKSEGFSSWSRVNSVAWGIEKTLGRPLRIAAIYDRDFYPEEELDGVCKKLSSHLSLVHIHERKEIENYLLEPAIIQRTIDTLTKSRANVPKDEIDAAALINEATAEMKPYVLSRYGAAAADFNRNNGIDSATSIERTTQWIEASWANLDERVKILPGKEALRRLRRITQERLGITLTDSRILSSYTQRTIPKDIVRLIKALEDFRRNSAEDTE